jgi:serine/threonine-protein kinase RsbW
MRKRRELKLPSKIDSIRTIEEFSERISDEYFLNDSYFGNIITSLSEAVENAIVHGNKMDEKKTVRIILEEKDEGLMFTVIDQGEGFDHKQYSESIPEGKKGEGIFLIRSLADEVSIKDGGRVISMLFRISGIDEKVAESRRQQLNSYRKAPYKKTGQHLD